MHSYRARSLLLVAAFLVPACAGDGNSGGDQDAGADAGQDAGQELPLDATVSVSNLRDHSVVETGFVLGTASAPGLSGVQVSLDGGPWEFATGAAPWEFALPTGAATWRDGSSHTIRVRATNGTAYSTPVSVTVRKGRNKDVNGDGYADLVAGAFAWGSNTGRAYVFHSAGSAGVTTTAAASANTILSGETTSNDFGVVTALGDVNGDGYGDVVVGASGHGTNVGRLYVFHSTGSAGVVTTSAASADRVITGENTTNFFGYSVILGDVNGDGYADIASGAYGTSNTTAGRMYVFHSAGDAGVTATSAASANTIIVGEAINHFFGAAVAMGDVNGDSYPDLVVGAFKVGKVYVFHSAGSAGVTTTAAASANTIITGIAGNARNFGGTVAVGDLNGDGYADVASGDDRYGTNAGRVYVFHSAGTAGVTITTAETATTTITGEAAADRLGYALAMGDVNCDGYVDLVPGAYYYDGGVGAGTGRVYVLYSAGAAGVTDTAAASAGTILTGEAAANDFGVAVATGDVNGDGYPDVIAGAQGNTSLTGRVYVFHSDGSTGVPNTSAASADSLISGQTTNSNLGAWVAQ